VPLAPYEVTWADNLPVTTATRTLVDLLATGIAASHAGSFLAEALDRRMISVGHVISELAPFARQYGCPPADGQALGRDAARPGAGGQRALGQLGARADGRRPGPRAA
jgi:hypothetical protein